MKKVLFFLFVVVLSGCAITTVEYRYKQRFDNFYRLLNDAEKKAFYVDDFVAVGASLDVRMREDEEFSNAMDGVMFDEAIHTFYMHQVAEFFKRHILPGFHQDDYAQWIERISVPMLVKFAYNDPTLVQEVEALKQNNRSFASWWRRLGTDGRLRGFSTEQVIAFYRQYIFPRRTHNEVFHIVRFLSGHRLLAAFMNREEGFVSSFETVVSQVAPGREWRAIRERAGLERLSHEEFFRVYREVILKEMDQEVLRMVLSKFPKE